MQAAITAAAAAAPPLPDGEAAANPLALPSDLAARITKQLKIHRHHLDSCWEATLYAHPGLAAAGPAAAAALQGLVLRRLREAHAQTVDQNTAGKKIVEVRTLHGIAQLGLAWLGWNRLG